MAKRFAIGALLGAMLLASCRSERAPNIVLSGGWAGATAPGQTTAAVYATIANQGDGDDRLTDVHGPAGMMASLHSSSSAGGVARMRPIENGVEIPAHSTVELKPGGIHIMLAGLKAPLKAGATIRLGLGFAQSRRRPVTVRVMAAGGTDPHSGHGMAM